MFSEAADCFFSRGGRLLLFPRRIVMADEKNCRMARRKCNPKSDFESTLLALASSFECNFLRTYPAVPLFYFHLRTTLLRPYFFCALTLLRSYFSSHLD